MAVFTTLTSGDIESILARYNVGVLVSFCPISSGIENTNYFVDTLWNRQRKSWVLTLFENLPDAELPYFVAVTQMLADKGLCVPAAVLDCSGRSIFQVGAKSGVLVPKLPGKALIRPGVQHSAQMGEWLARMHQVTQSSTLRRKSPRNRDWFATRAEQLLPLLSAEDGVLLEHLRERLDLWMAQLDACPKGLIHGDLFRDNVLFCRGQISGVIDFYHSCHAPLIFDLAIAINDWRQEAAIVQGYVSVRSLQEVECRALPVARVVAAWSFWLSRLLTKYQIGYQHSASAGQAIKNPDEMKRLLQSLLTGAL